MKCIGLTKSLQPCPNSVAEGREYCFLHDPQREAERSAARRRGGRQRSKPKASAKEAEKTVQDVSDLVLVLSECIAAVRRGNLPAREASAVASLANALLAAFKALPAQGQNRKVKKAQAAREEAIRKIRELYGMTAEPQTKTDPEQAN